MIAGIPWPATRNDAPKDGKEISDEVDGAFVTDGKPTHRMIFVHCHGAEVAGSSPTNPMQVEAAEYIVGLTAAKSRTTTQTLVLSPYRAHRAQMDLRTRRMGRSGNKAIAVSTVDAAQGQEADLVIISFVRANGSGKVGFTDDARRLNVAVARAKAGVVIIGHLATSLAASSSGFRTLLHDLKMQCGIFEYGAPGAREYMRNMSSVDYDKIPEDTPITAQEPKRRQDISNRIRIPRQTRQQEDPEVVRRKIEDTAAETRRHLVELVKSPSFLAAMAHVCSLTQRMDWATGSAPGEVIQWDRKTWSHENHFTAVGVSVDPGNHVLSIIMLAIRHILGMEPLLEARACSPGLRLASL